MRNFLRLPVKLVEQGSNDQSNSDNSSYGNDSMSRKHVIYKSCFIALASVMFLTNSSKAQDDSWRRTYPAWFGVVPPAAEQCPGANTDGHDPHTSWTSGAACREFAPNEAGDMPVWFSRVEAQVLYRDTKGSHSMATVGVAGPEVLGTSDFESEIDAGIRVVLGRSVGEWYRLEGVFSGAQEWSDSLTVRNFDLNSFLGLGNLMSPFTNFGDPLPILGLDFNDLASIRFKSQFNNAELNLRRRLITQAGKWEGSYLIGLRYMDVTEDFGYSTSSITLGQTSIDYDTHTSNHMTGVQLGLTTQFLIRPRMWIDFDIKGGVFANDASMSYSVTQLELLGNTNVFNGTDQQDRASYMGELSLRFQYQFTSHLTFTAGYNAILITGIALGADNFEDDLTRVTLGPARLNHQGEAVYHGPSFGLTCAW